SVARSTGNAVAIEECLDVRLMPVERERLLPQRDRASAVVAHFEDERGQRLTRKRRWLERDRPLIRGDRRRQVLGTPIRRAEERPQVRGPRSIRNRGAQDG